MKLLRSALLLSTMAMLALGVTPLRAQNVARIYEFSPAPGKGPAFEKALKAHAAWREKAGDPWTWHVYQVVNGEHLGEFIVRSGDHTWADLDAYEAGFGPKGSERFQADVAPLLASESSRIAVDDTAHQILPDTPDGYALISLVFYHLKADKTQAFDAIVDQVHKALVKSGWPGHYAWFYVVNGAEGPVRGLAIFHKDWASFKNPDPSLSQVLKNFYGSNVQEHMSRTWGENFWSTESMVLRYRPDMSVVHEGS